MFYIVGLGNPGEEYSHTRHNVGWLALTSCVDAWRLPAPVESKAFAGSVSEGVIRGVEAFVLYPSTYMNHSGTAVAKLLQGTDPGQLIVVHDDIDLPFGEVKISHGRGAGGNKGVQSIIQKLDSRNFTRLRIGIAPKSFWTGRIKRPPGGGPLERYVLTPFTKTEQKTLPEVFQKTKTAIEMVLTDGATAAMNRCN